MKAEKKRIYEHPDIRHIALYPMPLFGSSDEEKRGYAIDNDEHNDDNIIEVGRQTNYDFWELD